MIYKTRDIERIARSILNQIEIDLMHAGIFFRIFFRCKNEKSLDKKLSIKNENGSLKYDSKEKLIRDIIGIRINLYFLEDLDIITKFFKEKYIPQFVEETIDLNTTTEFKPTRVNIIYRIPEEYLSEFTEVIKDSRVDSTFELQLRTIFSEGWHEVEHDLRYKCQKDWDDYPDLSRTLNGILASLETNEWSMIQLFERLSYSHYKNGNVSAMIRTKLRIRFDDYSISDKLTMLLGKEETFSKDFFKLDRNLIVNFLLRKKIHFPYSLENMIYLINFVFIKCNAVLQITPKILLEDFEKIA